MLKIIAAAVCAAVFFLCGLGLMKKIDSFFMASSRARHGFREEQDEKSGKSPPPVVKCRKGHGG